MTTIFLRFPDQATFEALLPQGFETNGETVTPLPDGVPALSIIGQTNTGYLVNALDAIPDAWRAYTVTPDPATPWRVFG